MIYLLKIEFDLVELMVYPVGMLRMNYQFQNVEVLYLLILFLNVS